MKIEASVILKKGRDASARRFHPWIFSGAIHAIEGDPKDGDWVEVKDSAGKILGFGHYQKGTISVRLLSFSKERPPEQFYTDKLSSALLQRTYSHVINNSTNCFRLVHGEGDGLSGLIIDIYHDVAVIQAHSAGMHEDRREIAGAVKDVLNEKLDSIYYKSVITSSGTRKVSIYWDSLSCRM
jgi:23S rRNA (cytosine1962-C5)-methyltransferase